MPNQIVAGTSEEEKGYYARQLDEAAAGGREAVIDKAKEIALMLFNSTAYTSVTRTDEQYVTDLYEVYLQRAPDTAGLAQYTTAAGASGGRASVLNTFAGMTAFRELAGTIYREVNWLVTDHLGTPRMVVDRAGSLAGVKRHDYLPFGEEIGVGVGGRTTTQGYSGNDGVRQKFTSKERDTETGLDYFGARYYSSTQGRFTSVDPLMASGRIGDPQSWNRYVYALNSPLIYIDPDGRDVILVVWATQGGRIGHAGVAVSNYKKVEERVKEDGKWVTKTTMVQDGMYTYRDLWPGEGVGVRNYDENVGAVYNSRVVTKDQLINTDVTEAEGYAPDGAVLLKTDYSTDQGVLNSLDGFQNGNPQYNGVSCNCSDFAEQGVEAAAGQQLSVDENIKPPIGSTIVSTTPNQLFKATSALPNATVIKDPGSKVNNGFIEGVKPRREEKEKKN